MFKKIIREINRWEVDWKQFRIVILCSLIAWMFWEIVRNVLLLIVSKI